MLPANTPCCCRSWHRVLVDSGSGPELEPAGAEDERSPSPRAASPAPPSLGGLRLASSEEAAAAEEEEELPEAGLSPDLGKGVPPTGMEAVLDRQWLLEEAAELAGGEVGEAAEREQEAPMSAQVRC